MNVKQTHHLTTCRFWILLLILLLILSACVSRPAAAAEVPDTPAASPSAGPSETAPFTGWKKENGRKLYYKGGKIYTGWLSVKNEQLYIRKGRKCTGWQKIGKKEYHFTKKGILQKNQIVGSKKSGYAYVDRDGVRVRDKAVQAAVRFVVAKTKRKGSARSQLKKCYYALWKYPYFSNNHSKPKARIVPSYATYMFRNQAGDCYNYATSMAYVAKVLGYKARVGFGGVSSHAEGGLSDHGLCLVREEGVWKIIDASMGRVHTDEDCFMVRRSKYPFRLSLDRIYGLRIREGKAKWVVR